MPNYFNLIGIGLIMLKTLPVKDFSLKTSLESGQFFRFKKFDEWYYVTLRDSLFRVRQKTNLLEFEGCSQSVLSNFFGLNCDYSAILKSVAKDACMENAVSCCSGLRLLRQDPWECLVGFVLSSASNIKRITANVHSLSTGSELKLGSEVSRALPRSGKLTAIHSSKLGFRAKYLAEINSTVTEAWLSDIAKLPYESAKQELMTLPGVGEKIADCVLLFGYGFLESFPVDVWMQRVMQENYCPELKKPVQIAEFGRKHFGKNAGYAQQFLYHWRRTCTQDNKLVLQKKSKQHFFNKYAGYLGCGKTDDVMNYLR
ncbi:MAG: DNA glycosylase [Candidatus Woesearchaeota archaeon]|nr:DNA glycosylase [Candidatus Woesearchaeota archaeon]